MNRALFSPRSTVVAAMICLAAAAAAPFASTGPDVLESAAQKLGFAELQRNFVALGLPIGKDPLLAAAGVALTFLLSRIVLFLLQRGAEN